MCVCVCVCVWGNGGKWSQSVYRIDLYKCGGANDYEMVLILAVVPFGRLTARVHAACTHRVHTCI